MMICPECKKRAGMMELLREELAEARKVVDAAVRYDVQAIHLKKCRLNCECGLDNLHGWISNYQGLMAKRSAVQS